MNPKRQAQLSHKIAVLASLLRESLEEIEANSDDALNLIEKSKEIVPFCEKIIDDTYKVLLVRRTNYINDLSNKVDTVIRKNFIELTD